MTGANGEEVVVVNVEHVRLTVHPAPASSRRDAVTAGLGALLVAGVFTDGWAHFNRPGLETFFTPWHTFLYSGLGVMSLWLGAVAWKAGAVSVPPHWDALPRGYGLAVVGVLLFGAGGLADLAWHELFGIEVAVDALLSPTHLVLGAGGVLILSTGLRAQALLTDSQHGRWGIPARASLALTLAVVVFFLLYVSPFADPGPVEAFTPTTESTAGHEAAELPVVASLASYLLATVVITLPLIFAMRAPGRPPRGIAILVVATVALLPVVVVDAPRVPLAGALGAIAGSVTWELGAATLTARWWRSTGHWASPAALAALVWSGQLTGLAVADAVRWPVSLWSGTIVLGALLAAAIGFTAGPSKGEAP